MPVMQARGPAQRPPATSAPEHCGSSCPACNQEPCQHAAVHKIRRSRGSGTAGRPTGARVIERKLGIVGMVPVLQAIARVGPSLPPFRRSRPPTGDRPEFRGAGERGRPCEPGHATSGVEPDPPGTAADGPRTDARLRTRLADRCRDALAGPFIASPRRPPSRGEADPPGGDIPGMRAGGRRRMVPGEHGGS